MKQNETVAVIGGLIYILIFMVGYGYVAIFQDNF